ncbi:hypothetical protein NHX12_010529 [Muraenolepis orangiensis]|uniref:Arachidonate 5-lipoxygenase-activating protein n=1 Tax=Muraenolepis orangiensis TaxID=630683 RepID=A0A9Q0DJX7_9TELE|nr:hypothetical protein NHX12_010529 [Muraenolepis orangiensis]
MDPNMVVVEQIYLLVIVTLFSVLQNAPAAFAGILYLMVRQKYFIGYMGQSSQSTPGFLFGKRVIIFLVLMCIVGIFNYLLVRFFGSTYKDQVEIITSAASALLLIP